MAKKWTFVVWLLTKVRMWDLQHFDVKIGVCIRVAQYAEYENQPIKPNLPNHTYQTKPTKPNLPSQLPNQTYQTKLNVAYQA